MITRQIAPLCGIAGPLAFAGAALLVAGWYPGYSHSAQFVSELAGPESPVGAWMVWLGFVPGGVAIAAFAGPVSAAMNAEGRAHATGRLVRALGLGMIVAGISPCERGWLAALSLALARRPER